MVECNPPLDRNLLLIPFLVVNLLILPLLVVNSVFRNSLVLLLLRRMATRSSSFLLFLYSCHCRCFAGWPRKVRLLLTLLRRMASQSSSLFLVNIFLLTLLHRMASQSASSSCCRYFAGWPREVRSVAPMRFAPMRQCDSLMRLVVAC